MLSINLLHVTAEIGCELTINRDLKAEGGREREIKRERERGREGERGRERERERE